jgi:hypothetical protein
MAFGVARAILSAVLTKKQQRVGREAMRRLFRKQYLTTAEFDEMAEKCNVSRGVVGRAIGRMMEKGILAKAEYDEHTRNTFDLPRVHHRPPVVYVSDLDELARRVQHMVRGIEILADETVHPTAMTKHNAPADYVYAAWLPKPTSNTQERV